MLYAAAATPPQLANTGIFSAAPILVSGASSYRSGEYVYQDFLYDDHGAAGTRDPSQQLEAVANQNAGFAGTYTYPTNANYAGNAADLVEIRLKPTADATAFRITLNSMADPTLYAFTIGLGGSTITYAMPHGANAVEPADVFVTVHGSTGDVVNAATGATLGSATVSLDQLHRQVTVLLPYTIYDTRNNAALRVAVASGLWNNATSAYLVPQVASSATVPGGSGVALAPAAFFNVGFRHTEPAVGENEITDTATYWRDSAQAAALKAGNISPFFDVVDMTKVAAGANDDMPGLPQGVPTSGHINRILPSNYEPLQGRSFGICTGIATYCAPEYGSALQPYSVYVPVEAPPGGGYPLTLLLHSLSCNYNQFANTRYEKEFGERNGGSLVITTEGRGPDNWYYNLGEADVFEVWADVARHYPINSNIIALTGYSMGGYATWKLGVLFPDLFGKMQPTVGPTFVGVDATGSGGPTDTLQMFAALRNIPILSWHSSTDRFVQTNFVVDEELKLAALSEDYEVDLFQPADHTTLAINDQFAPAATFLGSTQTNANPAHVTFVRNPSMDSSAYDVIADHAYWVSNIVERDTSMTTGTIDAFSAGFGVGDPPTSGTLPVAGVLTGGSLLPALDYAGFRDTYGVAPVKPVADALTISVTNIATASIVPSRARIDCNAALNVTTDGPFALTLLGCPQGTHTFAKERGSRKSTGTGLRRH